MSRGYPTPSEIRHQWRLTLIGWRIKMKLFEKILYETPEWVVSTIVYVIGGFFLFLVMFGIT